MWTTNITYYDAKNKSYTMFPVFLGLIDCM